MKISELQFALEMLLKTHGDLTVLVSDKKMDELIFRGPAPLAATWGESLENDAQIMDDSVVEIGKRFLWL